MSSGPDDPNVAFADVVAASGRVRDALVTVGGDVEVLRRCARELEAIAGALTGCALSPGEPDPMAAPTIDPRYGIRRGGLIPRHTVTSEDGRQLTGVANIERHFDGAGAVHGGAVALLFDDLMGWLANSARRPLARTAFLHLDFRAPVPWGTDLEFGCRITRMEGRKRHLAGQLRHGGLVLAEATGLWIELRPSAPHCGGGR